MSSSHLLVGANAPAQLEVRHITPSDVLQALAHGLDDFAAMPSHALFLCVFYPLIGLCLIAFVSGDAMLPLPSRSPPASRWSDLSRRSAFTN